MGAGDPADREGMLAFLDRLGLRRGIRFGLARVRACLARLGDPQDDFLAVHVGGTKGKGSTAATLHSMLLAAGRRAALYTSPHLADVSERFVVGDRRAFTEELLRAHREVARASRGGQDPPLSYFEWLTCLAFVLFRELGVEVAVLEAGMGGRLDATRVAGGPLAVITHIGLDHTEFLGGTPAAIAREKAGLIPRGGTVISAPQLPEVERVLAARAAAMSARLVRLGEVAQVTVHGTDLGGVSFDLLAPGLALPRLHCPLPGRHQAVNAALAALAASRLADLGVRVPPEAVRLGLAAVRWPGRLEALGEDPTVILDGAHNPDSVRSLVLFLEEACGGPTSVVLGVMADKDLDGIMAALGGLEPRLYLGPCRSPRAASLEELAAAAGRAGLEVAGRHPSVGCALAAALLAHRGRGPVVVTGSLYAVAEARAHLRGEPYAGDTGVR